MRKAFVGVTDFDWFEFLSSRPELTEVNFWQPSARAPFRKLPEGTPFLFKLKRPYHHVAGGGRFVRYTRLPLLTAWDVFEQQNGADSLNGFQQLIAGNRELSTSLDTEIVDLDDPVELGTEAGWEVRVRNTGSKAATNISVACDVPAGVDLLTAKGPTEAIAAQGTVQFKSLPQLAPGQQAIYRVHVRGIKEGTHRLKAQISSDSLDQPVSIEEATKFYADAK